MNTKRRYSAAMAGLLLGGALLVGACSTGGDSDDSANSTFREEERFGSAGDGAVAYATTTASLADAGALAPSTGEGSPGGASNQPSQDSLPFDRKIIFTTALDLTVPDVTAAFGEVQRIARVTGGYVEQSNLSVLAGTDDSGAQRANVRLRVPATEYDDVLGSLRVLSGSKVTREEAKSNEVTEQYVDLESRMRNLERSEAQYLTLLAQATTIQEIMTVSDRLGDIRNQIEQAKGRLNVLDHMTEMATIDVSLLPVVPAKSGDSKDGSSVSTPGEAFTAAIELSGEALRVIAAAGAVALVGLGWLIPVGALVLLGRRVFRGRRPGTLPGGPAGPPATPVS